MISIYRLFTFEIVAITNHPNLESRSSCLPIIHLTSAILNFTRTLEVGIDFLAVSVLLADTHRMATCGQGIDGVGIRLCNRKKKCVKIQQNKSFQCSTTNNWIVSEFSIFGILFLIYRVFKYRPGESMSFLRTFRMKFLGILDHI